MREPSLLIEFSAKALDSSTFNLSHLKKRKKKYFSLSKIAGMTGWGHTDANVYGSALIS